MHGLIIAAAAMLLGWALTALLLRWLLRARRFAEPTERGLHDRAVPVGRYRERTRRARRRE